MSQPISDACHVVAIPYPGRGHVNPLLHLCRLILRVRPDVLISFIVTEEWLGFIRNTPSPPNLTFQTIPNVIPSEVGRGKNFAGFFEAVMTSMRTPVEHLLDRLPPPNPRVIIYDTYLKWAVEMGNRRNIPVASLYTMSATVFSTFHHFDLIHQNGHFSPNTPDQQKLEQIVNYIPGIPWMRMGDLPTLFYTKCGEVLSAVLEAIKLVEKAQYLLFNSTYELESQVIDSLKDLIPIKIYSLGLSTLELMDKDSNALGPYVDEEEKPSYMKWLDAQSIGSVLYISQGSFLSTSNEQLNEIIAGVCGSGVPFLWVGRGENLAIDDNANGIVVPWCDQMKVLCHPSVGGFWSHCGWNSTNEGAVAGVPMLSYPIFMDQVTNTKMIVDDWKIGVRVRKRDGSLVSREDVARLVLNVMGAESEKAKERNKRAKEIRDICRKAGAKGQSSEINLLNFIHDITK